MLVYPEGFVAAGSHVTSRSESGDGEVTTDVKHNRPYALIKYLRMYINPYAGLFSVLYLKSCKMIPSTLQF